VSLFITFEGPEGSGKTTQCRELTKDLASLGYSALHTREPGGTHIGQQIRTVLLDDGNTEMNPVTEFLLFSASRAQLVRQTIRPHLEQGGIVVCDRYFDSSLAYQGHGHGLDLGTLRLITELATDGLTPDLTFLLDIDPEVGLRRRDVNRMQSNRLDAYALNFHHMARQGFLDLARGDSERWMIVDAGQSTQEVQSKIRTHVLSVLERENQGRSVSQVHGEPGSA